MCCFFKNVFRTVPACGINSTNKMKTISFLKMSGKDHATFFKSASEKKWVKSLD